MAFAFVRGSGTSASTSSATIALAYAAAVASGNLLVCACDWQSGTLNASVADSVNGAWTPAAASLVRGAGTVAGYSSQIFYRPNTAAGTPTVTLTVGGAVTFRLLDILEYSGGATGTPLDTANGGTQATTTPSISLTTSQAGDLIVAHLLAAATGNVGTGFVERVSTSGNETEDKVAGGAAGTISVPAADSGSGGNNLVAAAFSLTNIGAVTLPPELTMAPRIPSY